MTMGLHGRIKRIMYWDVTVSALERTLDFYERLTTLRRGPIVAGFDAAHGAFRSCLLRNENATALWPTLNLIEWSEGPHGRPHDHQLSVGFFRIVMHVADLVSTRDAAIAAGAIPFAATTGDGFQFRLGSTGVRSYHVFAVHDPDGIVVEFIQNPSPKLSVVAQGTAAHDRTLSFYTHLLGLDQTDTVQTIGPTPNVYVPTGGTIEFRGSFFRVRGNDEGYLDWLEHRGSGHARAYPTPRWLGVVRCALEVDDLMASALALRAARWEGAPVSVAASNWVDLGDPVGRRRTLDLLDPEGVAYRLVEEGDRIPPLVHPPGLEPGTH